MSMGLLRRKNKTKCLICSALSEHPTRTLHLQVRNPAKYQMSSTATSALKLACSSTRTESKVQIKVAAQKILLNPRRKVFLPPRSLKSERNKQRKAVKSLLNSGVGPRLRTRPYPLPLGSVFSKMNLPSEVRAQKLVF